MNSTLLVLFMLFAIVGCNTEMADLGRISSLSPKVFQLATPNTEACYKVVIDQYENMICAGFTNSSLGALSDSTWDGFVSKFDRSGKLLWTVQLQSSGAGNDRCLSVEIDSAGNIYCGGKTDRRLGTGSILNKVFSSPVFVWLERTVSAVDSDAFIAKISPSGQLLWIKQFGSIGNESCTNITVAPSGNSYCAGFTDSEIGVDAASGMDEYLGGTSYNPMVAKLDTNGNIKWIRQFGALSHPSQYMAEDSCQSVAIDSDENIYCGGGTRASLSDTNGGGMDPFVWILDKNGHTQSILQVGTSAPLVLGVAGDETCYDLTIDKNKNIFCSITNSGNFGEVSGGGNDITVMKWNSSHQIEWVTQLGAVTKVPGYSNAGNQFAHSIRVQNDGSLLLGGRTDSSFAATISGPQDVFIAKLSPEGTLVWASQLGTSDEDICFSLTSDHSGNIYCAGYTTGTWGTIHAGGTDAIILRVNPLGKL